MPKNDQHFDPSHFSGEHFDKQKQEVIRAFEDPADKYPNGMRPAYPTNNRMFSAAQGLTKREYFAAMAMQGILTACNNPEIGGPQYEEKTVAENALKMADELIKQLEYGRP